MAQGVSCDMLAQLQTWPLQARLPCGSTCRSLEHLRRACLCEGLSTGSTASVDDLGSGTLLPYHVTSLTFLKWE